MLITAEHVPFHEPESLGAQRVEPCQQSSATVDVPGHGLRPRYVPNDVFSDERGKLSSIT
jgi:hypothetical protein